MLDKTPHPTSMQDYAPPTPIEEATTHGLGGAKVGR